MLIYEVRPLDPSFEQKPSLRRESRFGVTWAQALDHLEFELAALHASGVTFEVDVPRSGIRNDGTLRADARASGPGAGLVFKSRDYGVLTYRCDRFLRPSYHTRTMDAWQHNMRAIGLTLEALRTIDRYGATQTGQQYRGFQQLTSGVPMGNNAHLATMNMYDAIQVIARASASYPEWVEENPKEAIRRARYSTHPDRNNGSRDRYDKVIEAAALLDPKTS